MTVRRNTGPQLSGSNVQRAGDHNQRVTLHAIRVNGPVTRAALVKSTGLTAASIANITGRLLRERRIKSIGRTLGMRGQPAAQLAINPDSCFSIGLNVDRDHITAVLLDFAGRVRARAQREILFATPTTVRSFYSGAVKGLLRQAGVSRSLVIGVGVAFPDDIVRAQLPDQPGDYSAWGQVKIDELLKDILGVPVFVENDAAAAAIGEMQFGLGQQHRSFFYLLITASLGGGLVIDGSYFRGADGRSGEIGWLHGRTATGRDLELQNIVSLSALYSRLTAAGFRLDSPDKLVGLVGLSGEVVDRWLDEAAAALTNAMIAINCLINPEIILIGGRLPATLLDRLALAVNARMRQVGPQLPALAPVARAVTSADAPAVGAAILPFSHSFLPTRVALLKRD